MLLQVTMYCRQRWDTAVHKQNDSFDRGSINEEGQGNTNDEDVEEVVEYDGVSASLKEHESRDDCSLRQNLQNECSRSEGSEKKRRKVVSQKEKLLAGIFSGCEDQFLKEWQKKKQKSQNLVVLFLHSSEVSHKLLRISLPV